MRRRLLRLALSRVTCSPALGAFASDGLGEPQLLKPRTSPLPLPLLALQGQSPRKTDTRVHNVPPPPSLVVQKLFCWVFFFFSLFLLCVKWRELASGSLCSRGHPAPHRLVFKQVKRGGQGGALRPLGSTHPPLAPSAPSCGGGAPEARTLPGAGWDRGEPRGGTTWAGGTDRRPRRFRCRL